VVTKIGYKTKGKLEVYDGGMSRLVAGGKRLPFLRRAILNSTAPESWKTCVMKTDKYSLEKRLGRGFGAKFKGFAKHYPSGGTMKHGRENGGSAEPGRKPRNWFTPQRTVKGDRCRRLVRGRVVRGWNKTKGGGPSAGRNLIRWGSRTVVKVKSLIAQIFSKKD